jgi:hypothetical protein
MSVSASAVRLLVSLAYNFFEISYFTAAKEGVQVPD